VLDQKNFRKSAFACTKPRQLCTDILKPVLFQIAAVIAARSYFRKGIVMSSLKTFAVVCLLLISAVNAQEPQLHPQEIATHCVDAVDRIDQRVTEVVAARTAECREEIRRLLRAGEPDQAAVAARRCIETSKTQVRRATVEIRELCDRCAQWLLELGFNQLARRVYDFCDDTIDGFSVLLSRQREILGDALQG